MKQISSKELFVEKQLLAIGKKMQAKKHTVSVAESVTCGLLQFAFSNIPDAAQFFQGGITSYNMGQKAIHLSVEPLHAAEVNCVSQQVADQMAKGVAVKFMSDWGLAVTGYASAAPESDGKVFALYSIVFRGRIMAKGRLSAKGQRPEVAQLYYTNKIIGRLHQLV